MQPTPAGLRRSPMSPRHRIALAFLSLPLSAVLVACGTTTGGDQDSAGSNASKSDAGGSSGLAAQVPQEAAADSDGGGAAKPVADTAIQRSVIATGALRLTSRHLADARQDAINLANGLGGHVGDEQSRSDARGHLDRVDLTLRVPAGSFEKALDDLAALGIVRHREQSVEDVTTKVIDIAARVRAQQDSVDSIQKLLARAGTIGEIMSVEAQLSSRQAELDSLKQQQKWLADQTSLSTIQLTLTPATGHEKSDRHTAGFLGGLDGGWHALGATAVAVGTALGAVLPFAVVFALIGWPVWMIVRRRRVVAPTPAPEA